MANGEAVSFDPNDAVEGGGGLVAQASDVKLTFECVAYDYNGSVAVAVPAIHMHGEFEDEEGEDQEFEEYYSMGDASKLRASKDGTHFEALTEGAKPTKTCKGMQLISSIISANGGENPIENGNIKSLDGLVADVERKPDMERPGLSATNKAGRSRTILLISAIKALPGATPKKGAAKTKAAAAAAAAPAKPGKKNALRDKTFEGIKAVLEGAGGSIPVEDLPTFLFRKFKKDPDVKAMTELAADEDFLALDDAPFEVDGEDLKLKEE